MSSLVKAIRFFFFCPLYIQPISIEIHKGIQWDIAMFVEYQMYVHEYYNI
jgi:hypothetical protein